MKSTGAGRVTSARGSVPETRQILAVARLEMTSYLRSWGGLAFALLMPTVLLLVAVAVWYPPEARIVVVPDMTVLSVLASGFFSIGVAITEQRKDGTLKTYLSSPLRARTYLAGQVIDRVAVTAVGNLVMGLVAWGAFDITHAGTLVVYVAVAALSLATMLALGFVLASRFTSVEAAGAASSLLFFGVMLGSGFMVDSSRFPGWLASVLDLLPFKPIVDGMRSAWVDLGFAGGTTSVVTIAVWFVVFCVVASKSFRWTPDDR